MPFTTEHLCAALSQARADFHVSRPIGPTAVAMPNAPIATLLHGVAIRGRAEGRLPGATGGSRNHRHEKDHAQPNALLNKAMV